jgi:hypothetical protein
MAIMQDQSLHPRLQSAPMSIGLRQITGDFMRHLAFKLLSQEKSSKGGIKSQPLRCTLSFQYLEKVLHIS